MIDDPEGDVNWVESRGKPQRATTGNKTELRIDGARQSLCFELAKGGRHFRSMVIGFNHSTVVIIENVEPTGTAGCNNLEQN